MIISPYPFSGEAAAKMNGVFFYIARPVLSAETGAVLLGFPVLRLLDLQRLI